MDAFTISLITQLVSMALLAIVLIISMYAVSSGVKKKRIILLIISLVFEAISWAFLIIHSLP